jgi:hypothetical protein
VVTFLVLSGLWNNRRFDSTDSEDVVLCMLDLKAEICHEEHSSSPTSLY